MREQLDRAFERGALPRGRIDESGIDRSAEQRTVREPVVDRGAQVALARAHRVIGGAGRVRLPSYVIGGRAPLGEPARVVAVGDTRAGADELAGLGAALADEAERVLGREKLVQLVGEEHWDQRRIRRRFATLA